MTRPTIIIHNSQTNEIIEREMNDEEYAVIQRCEQENELKAELAAKKASAEAKLESLGLTPEDLKALGL